MTMIRPATFPGDLPEVTAIFREYVKSPVANLDFQDYEQEFAQLPGKYAEPDGCILLAVIEALVEWACRIGEFAHARVLLRVEQQDEVGLHVREIAGRA